MKLQTPLIGENDRGYIDLFENIPSAVYPSFLDVAVITDESPGFTLT